MKKNIEKDLRLWEKGISIVPFSTRSQRLAIEIMKTVGFKGSIVELFKDGKILKTNCKNPLSIIQEDITEEEEKIISDLNNNELLVYHVLESNIMLGKQTEIQCEHEVSTYEKVVSTINYLCVPKDVFAEAMSPDEDVMNESNRGSIIKEYMEHEIFMATQGYLYAYVVSSDDSSTDFYNIEINVLNGDLIRVS